MDFMLWRGLAHLGGVSDVDFNKLCNSVKLIHILKVNTDMVYQFNQNFMGQFFGVVLA